MAEHPDSIRNDVDSKTMTRIVMNKTRDSDLVILLNAISTACKLISRSVRKAGIAGLCKLWISKQDFSPQHDSWVAFSMKLFLLDGTAGSENATGDAQKKLDVLSDEMFINALYNSNVCSVLVSEEREEAIIVEDELSGNVFTES